jgi:hypothetical protein
VSWRQLCLPVLVRPGVTPLQHALQLLVCPCVEVDRFDFGDVRAHAAVNSRASNAYKDAKVPAGPSRVLVPLAVRACLVSLELHQVLERGAILLSAVSGRVGPPRHGGVWG